jgi:hypothetical protein
MKKLIESLTGLKAKTITTNFCFELNGTLNFNQEMKLRSALLNEFGIICLTSFSSKTIVRF